MLLQLSQSVVHFNKYLLLAANKKQTKCRPPVFLEEKTNSQGSDLRVKERLEY